MRVYQYVGPAEIREKVRDTLPGLSVRAHADVLAWHRLETPAQDHEGHYIATFVVQTDGMLRIASRHSEHVACAGGQAVLSAGEMYFDIDGEQVSVARVTNQSTGFCPEPESWPIVERALKAAAIPHPGRFEPEFVFRRCPGCGERNVVKEGWFECALCGADLPEEWNFQRP